MPEPFNYEMEDNNGTLYCHSYRLTGPINMETLVGFIIPTASKQAAATFLYDLSDCAARTVLDHLPVIHKQGAL